ncbi:hypothetical protein BGZ65_003774 [Modicella reniformis]|uniref:Uncharacterized protein n=1 Tax=Modicella reniformis TaxID=1440133 RepID=A0A9P6J688_9FUNG|nr:hypothetical protein BGZ65_003774 [Modicella reniformis]
MPRIPFNVVASLPRRLGPPPKALPKDFCPTDADARSLFRKLWRMGSLSVMYTNPGRNVIRQKIREAFEESKKQPKKSQKDIRKQWERALNTKFFFEIATTRFGVEHSVISNLSRIAAEDNRRTTQSLKGGVRNAQKDMREEYDSVIQALNESMGLSFH